MTAAGKTSNQFYISCSSCQLRMASAAGVSCYGSRQGAHHDEHGLAEGELAAQRLADDSEVLIEDDVHQLLVRLHLAERNADYAAVRVLRQGLPRST